MRRRCRYAYYVRGVKPISLYKAMEMMRQDNKIVLIDVRSVQEYREGHVPYSVNIPSFLMYQEIGHFVPDKNTKIICYCKTGGRSLKAVRLLEKMGYRFVYHIENGVDV